MTKAAAVGYAERDGTRVTARQGGAVSWSAVRRDLGTEGSLTADKRAQIGELIRDLVG